MEQELLQRLSKITEEEILLREGVAQSHIDPSDISVLTTGLVLPDGQSMGIYRHERFTVCPAHRHAFFELIYMCSGKTQHHIDGYEVELKQGEILLLNQRISHSIDAAQADDVAVNIIIPVESMHAILASLNQNNSFFQFFMDSINDTGVQPGYFYFSVGNDLAIRNSMESIIITMLDGKEDRRGIAKLLMKTLFVQLLNFEDEHLVVRSDKSYEMALVKRAQEYIEDCFDRASLSDLAKQMGVPLYYYSRLISQHTGQSFKKLLMHRRLFYAAHLLASSGVSVLDVIACTGYSNASHFYRIFAQNYGMTPAEYRLYHTNRQDDLAGCHPAD